MAKDKLKKDLVEEVVPAEEPVVEEPAKEEAPVAPVQKEKVNPCPDCNGTGVADNKECERCEGTGKEK